MKKSRPLASALAATTALALVASATTTQALPLRGADANTFAGPANADARRPVLRVQGSVADAEAALAAAQAQLAAAQANGGDVASAQAAVAQAEAAVAAARAAESAPPPPEPAPEEAPPAPEPPVEAPAPEPEPQPEAPVEAPAPEVPAPEAPPAEVPAEPPVEDPAPPAETPAEPQAVEPAAPQDEEPAEPSPLPEAPAEIPAPDAGDTAPEAPAAEPAPQAPAAEPAPEAPAQTPAPEAGGAPAPAAPADPAQPANEPAPPAEAPAESPAAPAAPAPDAGTGEAPQPGQPTPADPAAPASPSGEAPAAPGDGTATITPEATLPVEGGAPILDSAKEEPATAAPGEQPAAEAQPAAPVEPPAPPPTNDAEAQAVLEAEPVQAPEALTERGERIDAREIQTERQAPENVQIIQQIDNRTIYQIDNHIVIESSDSERIRGRAEEVYYERLPRGRTREVIQRANGTQIVTIRDRWGEVVQRSKILPDGREILLAYVPREEREGPRGYYDPGRDLPPLRLTIPVEHYILDATRAEPDDYYEFLEEPPVERVERIYSIDEVRHSARLRDKVRRIDLDTLTFEFGKATIPEEEVAKLASVAEAIAKILDQNPGETFLIEGHTDAVGTDRANLLLSDRRAEAVAVALSDVFEIAPENLVTQGYGERYLKVQTEEPERLNRRVTIRRITPLVTPVAAR
jgi:Outer membrane protein and related peptidoglycan-associated (lipo)proteins